MLHPGEPEGWPLDPLAVRLDRAYYDLTRATKRHFGEPREGWFLTGVAGLDAPTMNRAVVEEAHIDRAQHILDESGSYFAERDCSWSVVLSSFRPPGRWHGELVMRGMQETTTLEVLAREPAPIEGDVPDVGVREARREEAGLFTELLMDVFRMPRRFYPALLDMTEAWRKAGAKLYLAVDEEGEAVGTTLLSFTDGVAGIYNVGIVRRARRQGYARALMARALEDSRKAEVVTLQVAPEGFVESFYLDLGFMPVYHWRFYTPRARIPFFR